MDALPPLSARGYTEGELKVLLGTGTFDVQLADGSRVTIVKKRPQVNGGDVLVADDGSEYVVLKGTEIPLATGDVVTFLTAGGGGYGEPKARAAEAVKRDVSLLESFGLVNAREEINPGHGLDAECRMHHDHHDDAEALCVIDPVDARRYRGLSQIRSHACHYATAALPSPLRQQGVGRGCD